jgi:hypothetical protein
VYQEISKKPTDPFVFHFLGFPNTFVHALSVCSMILRQTFFGHQFVGLLGLFGGRSVPQHPRLSYPTMEAGTDRRSLVGQQSHFPAVCYAQQPFIRDGARPQTDRCGTVDTVTTTDTQYVDDVGEGDSSMSFFFLFFSYYCFSHLMVSLLPHVHIESKDEVRIGSPPSSTQVGESNGFKFDTCLGTVRTHQCMLEVRQAFPSFFRLCSCKEVKR